MSHQHLCPCAEQCLLQRVMLSIGGKWKLPILCSLAANGSSRYNDLFRSVKGISNTMLSKSLKELGDGLVRRSEFVEVPIRVEYELTERAASLQPILLELIRWAADGEAVGWATGPRAGQTVHRVLSEHPPNERRTAGESGAYPRTNA